MDVLVKAGIGIDRIGKMVQRHPLVSSGFDALPQMLVKPFHTVSITAYQPS